MSDGPSNDQAVHGTTCVSCGEKATHLGTYYSTQPPFGATRIHPYCQSCLAYVVASASPPRSVRLMDWRLDELNKAKAARSKAANRAGRPRLPGI